MSYITHRMTNTRPYLAWRGMLERCHNPKNPGYHRYGGRGIGVCREWRDSFEDFYGHIGPHPGKGYSIDRIDNSRGYEPGNVRWADRKTQQQNLRSNVYLSQNGESHCLHEWSRRTGIPESTIQARAQRGLSVQEILRPYQHRDAGLRGVYPTRTGKYCVQISIKGTRKLKYIGTYASQDEAVKVASYWREALAKSSEH